MKKHALLGALATVLLLAGCGASPTPGPESGKTASIPYSEGQLYAAAYLGYGDMDDLAFYTETYLEGAALPVHYVSGGEFYLIIPRYPDTAVRLYENDIQTMESRLIYEDPDGGPFIVQCNVSDIFSDVTVSLTCREGTAEFSPYISLEDGSVQVGDLGLNLTE